MVLMKATARVHKSRCSFIFIFYIVGDNILNLRTPKDSKTIRLRFV